MALRGRAFQSGQVKVAVFRDECGFVARECGFEIVSVRGVAVFDLVKFAWDGDDFDFAAVEFSGVEDVFFDDLGRERVGADATEGIRN